MIGPINYAGQLAQLDLTPLQNALQSRNLMRANAERTKLQRDQFVAEQTKQQSDDARKGAFFNQFATVSANPTAEGWQQLRGQFPEYHAEIGNGQKEYSARQNLIGRDVATNLYARLNGGDTAGALQFIDNSLPTLTANGLSTDTMATIRQLVASGKPEQMAAANRITTMALAQYSGDRFNDVLGTLGREDRANELQPFRVDRAQADADYAETRADYAPEQQRQTLIGKQARNAKAAAPPAPRTARGPRAPARDRAPTMAGTMAPILAKVTRGEALSAGEQQAWSMYRSGRKPAAGKSPPAAYGGGVVSVRSRAEAERLPPGTMFRTPDGRTLRR